MRKAAVRDVLERTGKHSEDELDQLLNDMDNSPAGKDNGKEQAPVGGICLRAAERKYQVPNRTISRWVARGLIPELRRTKNELYVDENVLAAVVAKYKQAPGRGKRTIINDN